MLFQVDQPPLEQLNPENRKKTQGGGTGKQDAMKSSFKDEDRPINRFGQQQGGGGGRFGGFNF